MSRPTTMKVDGTVYWAIFTYTDAGVLVDADSTPSVAVRKNGAAVGDAVTITKRAATTGIYDCSHNPAGEVDGDTFGYEETATISSQDYPNVWSLEVQATAGGGGGDATAANQATIIADIAALNDFNPASDTVLNVTNVAVNADMRGTDGANTVVPVDVSSDVTAILADTNELQQNQGDWATATGFNTVAPDNASVALILADTNELQGNQGDWATATGFNTVAPDNASIAAILVDTNELQSNQGDWATATTTVASNMRGTDNALLASSAPANWSTLIVGTGVDAGKVTTSNPASGGGSAHTAQDVANLILAVPTTPLANTVTGSLSLVDTTTNLTNGGSGGDSAATIYAYFTAGNNEDAFKATGFATPADVTTSQGVVTAAISSLNDFDPALDVVSHVTLVDTTTNLTNGGGSGGGGGGTITVKATPTPRAF